MVTSWKISEHSRTAQELMCQKCAALIDHETLIKVKCHGKVRVDDPAPATE